TRHLTRYTKRTFFGALLVYHALIYGLVSLILIITNFMAAPENLIFGWPMGMWGIIFGIHVVGILTFEHILKKETNFFKKRYPQYEDRKHSYMAKLKVLNFWMLIAHIAYFIVGNIIIYSLWLSDIPLVYLLFWSTSLGLHAFAFSFYYYVKSVKAAYKGLIIHGVFFGAVIAGGVYQLSIENILTIPIIFLIEPVLIWSILIGFHALVAHNWTIILANAVKIAEKQVGNDTPNYKIVSRAKWLAFWNWTLIAHGSIFSALLIFSTIQVLIDILPLDILMHITFGEGIGLSMHGAINHVYSKNIRKFWKWTFVLHFIAYIVVGAYLITLNLVFEPGIPISAVALAGWAIGIGVHYIFARFS
ncbi:MAG: 2TM domain-containing protein, partial [Promethearchaeota archaeon]